MYRDDDTAREAYTDALERQASRVEKLEQRVRELEAENRELRAALAAPVLDMHPVGAEATYLDEKLEAYIQDIIQATREPILADTVLSGALPIDALRIADAARDIARAQQRRYVIPDDVKLAARDVLSTRIIMRDMDADPADVIDGLLDAIEVQ